MNAIKFRDFLNPYLHGWIHVRRGLTPPTYRDIFQSVIEKKEPCFCQFEKYSLSLKGKIKHFGFTLLLWTPLINVITHIILTHFFPLKLKSPSERIQERSSHLTHLSEADQLDLSKRLIPFTLERKVDLWARTAIFDPNFKQVGLFKVVGYQDKQGQNKQILIDLRKLDECKITSCKTYAPFEVVELNEEKIFLGSNQGWLTLSPGNEKGIWICRIDSFLSKKYRLGSALVQFAIEKSMKKGFGGKVRVRSTNASAFFYYKLGFVSHDPEYQKVIEMAYINNERIDGGEMYLPEEAIESWKKKIQKNPIFLKTFN